jgi:hypothetical protein
MSRIKQTIYGIALSSLLLATSAAIAETEIRTLQSWNLPHPFQGPKSLTENVFALLIHPALRDYAMRHELDISYSKEDDCLIVSGEEASMETVNKVLSQLKAYGHPYGDLFSSESSKLGQATVYRFKKICTKEGGKNLLRLELEYLPTTPPSWSGPVRYGMRPGTYETLGAFDFPATVTGSKEREIEGELLFSAKAGGESVHALSYRGMSKTDLRQKLGSRTDQASVYLDIPYKQLIRTSVDQEADWALYRAGSRALKFLCPNYNNPRVAALFNDQHFRQILQKIVDLQYHFDAVGITDTGLQPTDTQNVLDFYSWRAYSNNMREKQQTQILNEWKTWITGKEKKESRNFENYFYVEGGRLYDLETDEMPAIKVFFADNINDQRFFDNLKSFLADKGMIDLQVNGRNDFITADRFRSILSGQETLLEGQEGVVLDLAVPYNDHIENYFTLDENFFGLTEKISPEVVKQAQEMTQGEWSLDSTKKLGRLLREECPCLIIGQHPFYVYTRKTEQYQLKSARFSDSAPTSYRLAERIRVTSGVASH